MERRILRLFFIWEICLIIDIDFIVLFSFFVFFFFDFVCLFLCWWGVKKILCMIDLVEYEGVFSGKF